MFGSSNCVKDLSALRLMVVVEQIENTQLKHAILQVRAAVGIVDIANTKIVTTVNTKAGVSEVSEAKTPRKIGALEIAGPEIIGLVSIALIRYIGENTQLRTSLQAEAIIEHVLQ